MMLIFQMIQMLIFRNANQATFIRQPNKSVFSALKIVNFVFHKLLVLNVIARSIKLQRNIKESLHAKNVSTDVCNVMELQTPIVISVNTKN